MFLLIGAAVVFAAVLGGYAASGGHLFVLWQPFEALIIIGAAIGAFIIGNPKAVLNRASKALGHALKGSRYTKESYLELLTMMYQVFKLAKSKGMLALEQHVENPDESSLFSQFPAFHGDHHVVTFLCDYLRMISLGTENPHEIEALIDEEIETHHTEQHQVSDAVQTMADGMPALGIVAAVLGVIKTMGSITEPPEILGGMIGGALVGTFMGVFLAYGLVGPIAARLKGIVDEDAQFYHVIRDILVAHLHGNSAQVSVEIGRGSVPGAYQPSFQELETALNSIPPEGA
jgi:chemotaxis protein MotA